MGSSTGGPGGPHVAPPGWFTRNVLNRIVTWASRRGVGLAGSRVLAVRGRKSGDWRRTPVNPLTTGGADYLVAARGHVQWTYNLRTAGGGQLLHGKRVRNFTAVEIPVEQRAPMLRAYLKKWGWEVGSFFEGVSAKSSDTELLAIAPRHPVFRLTYQD